MTSTKAEFMAPASFAQQRLWLLDQMEGGESYTYITPVAFHLTGVLNEAALEQSLNELVQRHETLRTTFRMASGQLMQVVAAPFSLDLPLTNLSSLPPTEQSIKVHQILTAESQCPFDLVTGPLLRAHLLRLAEQKHTLFLAMHHIISDGWSMGIFERELAVLYRAFSAEQPSPLPELPLQYADFAQWQRDWLRGELLEKQLAYWRKRLDDEPPPLNLPIDHPRPLQQTFRGRRHPLQLSSNTLNALKSLSRQENATLFMTLLAAFKTLLYRYTHQEDVTIGTPIANRTRLEIEPLIGVFVNTLVLRTDLSGNPTFRDLIERVRGVAFGAYMHQDIPFEKLVESLQPQQDTNRSPFFQTMFVLQNTPREAIALPDLTISVEKLSNGSAKFDLVLTLTETAAGLTGFFEYNNDLFEATTIERMAGHLETLLAGIIANPDTPIGELPLLTEAEQRQLLQWSGPESNFPTNCCLHHWFEAQVEQTPEAIALTLDGTHLIYADLNRRANQLARYLRALGVKPGDLVGLCLERSFEMIIGILGTLKAGAAYLPLDAAAPPDRLAFILEDAQARILLTQAPLTGIISNYQGQVVNLDSDWPVLAQYSPINLTGAATPTDLAYVIYTSGSTGRPKGVLVTHANVVRLFTSTEAWYQFDQTDVWTLFHSYAFDFSVWEIWGALLYGGRLVIVPYWVSRTPEDFYKLLRAERVTVLNQTPSAFHQLIQAEARLGLSLDLALRYIIFGGEALEIHSLKPWFERHGDQTPQLINMYGITETTVHVTYHPLTAADLATGSIIGRPIPDLQLHLLDSHRQPVPIGVTGELYIGGAGVSRGYLNRPELTAERFVEVSRDATLRQIKSDNFPQRLYKSGDLARYLPNGDLEYLGRRDYQIQLRGFRIELGEIEATLAQHPKVGDVLMMICETMSDEPQLVAYVVGQSSVEDHQQSVVSGHQLAVISDNRLLITELRQFLKDKLPEYMIPSAFVVLKHFPLTINGKIDRRALPIPGSSRSDLSKNFTPPEGPVEEMLAEIWQTVLHIEQVGLHDNFFHLGGHSLLATQVILRLQEDYDIDLPLRQLFESPTIAELAPIIEAMLINEVDG